MRKTQHSSLIAIPSIFIGSLFIFILGLNSQEIIGFDSRFYLFAQEMLRYGINWFPTTYHQIYPDYPATSTVLIFMTANLMDGLNKFTAVLPSAVAAAFTLTVTYAIGALHNKRWGLCGVFFMLLTLAFLKSARSISLDMYPTLMTACCFYLIYSADILEKPYRAWLIFPFLILGFAFRGPIGLVIPVGVVCTYYLFDLKFKKLFVTGLLSLFLLILSVALLLVIANHVGGHRFVQDVLRMQVLGRIDNSFQPPYFYFVDGLWNYALSFPVACLVLLGGFYYRIANRRFITPEIKLLMKLFGWMVIIMIGMSIPGDKKIRYILPMVPAVALIAAYPFAAPPQEKYFTFLRKLLLTFFAFLPFLLLAGIVYVSSYTNKNALNIGIQYSVIMLLLAVLQFISFLICFPKKSNLRPIFLFIIAVLSVAITNMFVMERIELFIDRGRDFVQQVEAIRIRDHAHLVFYRERPDGLPIKYLINMPYSLPSREQPMFIDNAESLAAYTSPAFFVASESYFDELPKEIGAKFQVVARDSLGHIKVVVFARTAAQ